MDSSQGFTHIKRWYAIKLLLYSIVDDYEYPRLSGIVLEGFLWIRSRDACGGGLLLRRVWCGVELILTYPVIISTTSAPPSTPQLFSLYFPTFLLLSLSAGRWSLRKKTKYRVNHQHTQLRLCLFSVVCVLCVVPINNSTTLPFHSSSWSDESISSF